MTGAAWRRRGLAAFGGAVIVFAARISSIAAKPHGDEPPFLELKGPVIWSAECDGADGGGIWFGGEDQNSADGCWHTHIKNAGKWEAIDQKLRDLNPLQKIHDAALVLAKSQKDLTARGRAIYFGGKPIVEQSDEAKGQLIPGERQLMTAASNIITQLQAMHGLSESDALQAKSAEDFLEAAVKSQSDCMEHSGSGPDGASLAEMRQAQVELERAAEAMDAEPPPRALSPIVCDRGSNLYLLFGGDHLDYLTNDTWVFDPVKGRWSQRHPGEAPRPRANHSLKADGDGKVHLSGGYIYQYNTDYMGGQYVSLNDGDWVYDIAANKWTGGKGGGIDGGSRAYREKEFVPEFFMQGARPDAEAFAAILNKLPANTWVKTKPPELPQLNRDWGSAVLDTDRGLILRWSGGHCAHGGTDVLMYHLETNRWELPYPVEFPLGQLYSNTSYPEGVNFNGRPWVTGHTYQNYGYDPILRKMLFTGQSKDCYVFDPDAADWTGRISKPGGMKYYCCFYTLTCCSTPEGLVCWTEEGNLFRFNAKRGAWAQISTTGKKPPGSVVDNSTVIFDSKRDRLLLARVPGYGKTFDGTLTAVDLKSGEVSTLAPEGRAAAAKIPYLVQLRYDSDDDILFDGATLPPDGGGLRRTPAYDCAANRWVSLAIKGEDPSGKEGRNVSLGLMYDGKRKLFWGVDTRSHVYVLRLELGSADVRGLE